MKKINWLCAMALVGLGVSTTGKVKAAETNTATNTTVESSNQNQIKENTVQNTATSLQQNNVKLENKNEVVKINYNGRGQVAVWDNYQAPHQVVKYVPKNSSWKSFKIATLNNNKQWYNLGGSQWVDGQYITSKSNTSSSTPNYDKSSWNVKAVNEKATVYYTGRGKVAIWSNYDAGKKIVKYVAPNTSWKVFKEATPVNGYVWYNLGGNQWLVSQYATTQKIANNGSVTTKTILNKTSHQPFADPADLRKPMQWNNSSEAKAYPNLKNIKNLWIRVSILGNRTYVMSGNTPVYTMYSSAGRIVNGKSLTPTGTYHVQAERGLTFVGAHYWVSWKDHGVYLFHSTVTNGYNGPYNMTEAHKLGSQPLSHGCIRLTVSDSRWFYNQLPTGTKVVIANN